MKNKIMIFASMLGIIIIFTLAIGFVPDMQKKVLAVNSDYYSPFDIAYSPNGSYIASSDLTKGSLVIIETATNKVTKTIQLNGQPKGVAWSASNLVYVAEYDGGNVAEIDPVTGNILRRFPTGPKPLGVKVSGNNLIVTDFGLKRVTIVDLTAGTMLGNVTVNDYPMFLDITPNGAYAVVGHATPTGDATLAGHASSVTFIDIASRTVAANIKLPMGSTNVRGIKCSPDGTRVYVAHTFGKQTLPPTQLEKGWTNTNVVSILDASQRKYYTTILLDTMSDGAADPWGLAISSDNNTLWVSVSGIHQVYKVDLRKLYQLIGGSVTGSLNLLNRSKGAYDKPYSDLWFMIKSDPSKISMLKYDLSALWGAGILTKIKLPGQGPRGISISPNGSNIATGAYFAGKLYVISATGNNVTTTISLGTQPAEDSVRRGERLFFDGSNTLQGWLSCSSCHPGVRADGFNWDEANDGLGNYKNTKTLLNTFEYTPKTWRGIRPDAATSTNAGFKFAKFIIPTAEQLSDTENFLRSLSEEKSPYLNADGTMTADAQAGKAIFESSAARCSSCHSGIYFTSMSKQNVGTVDSQDTSLGFTDGYIVPTLIELWRTAPYLHNGTAPTVLDVFTTKNPANQHGTTSQLTTQEKNQLAAYLLQISGGDKPITPTPAPTPTPVPGSISIACGSSADVGSFKADQYYSGGSTYNNTNTIDVSQITSNPPPLELFNNERYGAMSYTIPGFTSGSSNVVTLYFVETYLTSSGSRLFNVSVNGTTVLESFDIYASAGGQNKAIARSFTTTADSGGQIVIQLAAVTENPKINGISINSVSNGGILGDVNESGTVDIVDALLIAQYYVGLNPSGFTASNADVNCSESIDIVDALLVAQYYVGLITSFPC